MDDESSEMTLVELDRMTVEITMGYSREESQVPITEETTKAWNILTKEIAEIKAKGWIVDIPFD